MLKCVYRCFHKNNRDDKTLYIKIDRFLGYKSIYIFEIYSLRAFQWYVAWPVMLSGTKVTE